MKRKPRREIFECPNCGADVPLGAAACRECGSDSSTGWQSEEEIDYQSLELPDGYAQDAHHPGGPVGGARPRWLLITALVAAAAIAAWAIWR
jgi:hypothetical protein